MKAGPPSMDGREGEELRGWARGEGVAMVLARDPRRPRVSSTWFLSGLFVAGWTLLWFAWLQPLPVQSRTLIPEAPYVSYMPLQVDRAEGRELEYSIRTTWSPALFSLPTPVGFSRSVLTNDIGIRPPVAMPGGPPRFLQRVPAPPAPMTEDIGREMALSVGGTVTNFLLRRGGPAVFTSLSVTGATMRITLAGGLEGLDIEGLDIGPLPASCTDRPWEASAQLETDADGRVSRVFLEQGSPSTSLDGTIVRSLKRSRVFGGAGPYAGRVVFRCFVPSRQAAAGEEGRQP